MVGPRHWVDQQPRHASCEAIPRQAAPAAGPAVAGGAGAAAVPVVALGAAAGMGALAGCGGMPPGMRANTIYVDPFVRVRLKETAKRRRNLLKEEPWSSR